MRTVPPPPARGRQDSARRLPNCERTLSAPRLPMHEENPLYPLSERKNRVHVRDFAPRIAAAHCAGPPLAEIFPGFLAARDLREFVGAVLRARRDGRPVVMLFGAHVLKVGLGPLVIQLLEAGFIQHLATNGAASIHDFEIALIGATSEDVAENLDTGRFGHWRETGQLNEIIKEAAARDQGYGESVGRWITEQNLPFREHSVFARAGELGVPVTVHAAIGTEIIHQHPNADGAAIGATSLRDFHRLVATLRDLEGGVVMNWGSSVIMPEVFLKALAVARNQGAAARRFTTADFDMLRHYRPLQNIVRRPTAAGGRGYSFTGHHEIMLPLVALLLLQGGGSEEAP